MKRGRSVEPVVLNNASAHGARRYRPIDVILTVLFALVAVVIFVELAKPRVFASKEKDPYDLARANMDNLTTPLELYRQKVGAYPTSLNDLDRLPSGMTQEAWGGPYIQNVGNLKDAWGRPLRYRAPGLKNPKWYDLWSMGKDGVDGTKDDVKNW